MIRALSPYSQKLIISDFTPDIYDIVFSFFPNTFVVEMAAVSDDLANTFEIFEFAKAYCNNPLKRTGIFIDKFIRHNLLYLTGYPFVEHELQPAINKASTLLDKYSILETFYRDYHSTLAIKLLVRPTFGYIEKPKVKGNQIAPLLDQDDPIDGKEIVLHTTALFFKCGIQLHHDQLERAFADKKNDAIAKEQLEGVALSFSWSDCCVMQ